ncbi:unnamed protein product [Phytomonas sp. EM1]|nr:unnamed protein product [Phytomonas sp. EM1]|eukprot:CCW63236.1 unnamed protein product [Phytomonas sp. isolate EM1]
MMVNAERVAQRIDLVGSSSGSIVSVATWCALHAHDFDTIMGCIGDKLKADSTADTTRASLLYVLHEVLLTCAARGVSQGAQRTILTAISRTLPNYVDSVLQKSQVEAHASFIAALGKVLVWWDSLNMFPRAWIHNLRKKQQQAEAQVQASSGVSLGSASMLASLQRVFHLMSRYEDAKQQWKMSRLVTKDTDEDGSRGVATTGGHARRALIALREAVGNYSVDGTALSQWCDQQWRELEGQDTGDAKAEDANSRVMKTEVKPESNLMHEEDVLGSFY